MAKRKQANKDDTLHSPRNQNLSQKQKKESKNPVDQKYSPSLMDDGWLGAIDLLNHDELDPISRVSTGMFSLAEKARPKAVKTMEAKSLSFLQDADSSNIFFCLNTEGRRYTLDTKSTKSRLFKEMSPDSCLRWPRNHTTKALENSLELIQRITTMVQKFSIKKFEFNKIWIDINFLEFIQTFIHSSPSFSSLEFNECSFVSADIQKRFIPILLSLQKLKMLTLTDMKKPIDIEFLSEFSKDSEEATLSFTENILWSKKKFPIRRAPSNFMQMLSKFKDLYMPFLIVNPDGLLQLIKERIYSNKFEEGTWKFLLSRKINREDVESILDSRMKCDTKYGETGYDIMLKNTTIGAELWISESSKWTKIKVEFNNDMFNDDDDDNM